MFETARSLKSSCETAGNEKKNSKTMAKLSRKDRQNVLLLDDSSAPRSAPRKKMNHTHTAKNLALESIARLEKLVAISPNGGMALNVALIYEDAQTREWAREAYGRVAKLADKQGVRPTWWNLNNLGEPSVLAAAVSTAMRSEVIIVAARAGEGMPLAFYTWINAWLPNRFQGGGVLAGLLGKTQHSGPRRARVGEYLREVARQGRMSFLLETRELHVEANGVNGFMHTTSDNGVARNGSRTLASIRF